MPSRDLQQYLEDILENIEAARSFTKDLTLEQFIANRQVAYATVRALEIISEASRHVSDDTKQLHPEIEWKQVSVAGNIYRHGYPAVDNERIWKTVTEDLEPLYQAVRAELERYRERERDEDSGRER